MVTLALACLGVLAVMVCGMAGLVLLLAWQAGAAAGEGDPWYGVDEDEEAER